GNGNDSIDFGSNGATNFTLGAVTITNKDGPSSVMLADSIGNWSSLGVTVSNGNGHPATFVGSKNGGTTLITGNLKVANLGGTLFQAFGQSVTVTGATAIGAGATTVTGPFGFTQVEFGNGNVPTNFTLGTVAIATLGNDSVDLAASAGA